jgi:hypothetical protein
LIDEIKPDYATCTVVFPYPGSKLYQIAKEKGYVSDSADWTRIHYVNSPTLPTKNLTRDDLRKEYRLFLKKIAPLWIKRQFNFLDFLCNGISQLKYVFFCNCNYLFSNFFYFIRLKFFNK